MQNSSFSSCDAQRESVAKMMCACLFHKHFVFLIVFSHVLDVGIVCSLDITFMLLFLRNTVGDLGLHYTFFER